MAELAWLLVLTRTNDSPQLLKQIPHILTSVPATYLIRSEDPNNFIVLPCLWV